MIAPAARPPMMPAAICPPSARAWIGAAASDRANPAAMTAFMCPPGWLKFSERLWGHYVRSVNDRRLIPGALISGRSFQERIARPLAADGARRPVAADEAHVVAERDQLVFDRSDERRMVAARQVAAADRAGKQHVADDGEALLRVEEGDAAGRVAGAMQHRECERTDRDRIAVVEPAIGQDVAGA